MSRKRIEAECLGCYSSSLAAWPGPVGVPQLSHIQLTGPGGNDDTVTGTGMSLCPRRGSGSIR